MAWRHVPITSFAPELESQSLKKHQLISSKTVGCFVTMSITALLACICFTFSETRRIISNRLRDPRALPRFELMSDKFET